jgi:hypothetical protein
MTDPAGRPSSPQTHRTAIRGSQKPALAAATQPAPALPVIVLAHAFFAPEVRAWRGEQPLWIAFWGYGVLGSVALAMLWALSLYLGRTGLQEALLLCIAAYTFWALVALWRSSKPVLDTMWGALARQLTVAWAVNVILILGFLQLDLVSSYFDVSSAMHSDKSATNSVIDDDQGRISCLLESEEAGHRFTDPKAP